MRRAVLPLPLYCSAVLTVALIGACESMGPREKGTAIGAGGVEIFLAEQSA